MRREMTDVERMLWDHLRGGQLLGLRFRRQQVLAGFIVDFYCHAARLMVEVEVDGEVHANQADYDSERDKALARRGLRVMRFSKDDALTRLPDVLAKIIAACCAPDDAS